MLAAHLNVKLIAMAVRSRSSCKFCSDTFQISFASSLARSPLLTCRSTLSTRLSASAMNRELASTLPSYHDRITASLRRRSSAISDA